MVKITFEFKCGHLETDSDEYTELGYIELTTRICAACGTQASRTIEVDNEGLL